MKKTLALVLALAMVFSTITVAFAEGTIGADAQICADLGMLKGSTGTVDAAYVATAPTRIQAAVMFLRLKGLEAEATAFTGAANFADADKAAWAKPIMAYLKANPQLGWQGDGTNFDPTGLTTAQAYYKVMLEALGYKQTTPEVVGDFAYADVITFAASKGLTKVATVTNYTVNDLATATVEALKANMKDGGKTLVATLVEAGKIDSAKAVAAGLPVVEAPEAVTAVLDDVTAVGNTVVEVTFEDDVDAASAGDVANYAIEGLTINAAVVADTDIVRLETAPMTSGKLYTLTVNGQSVQFTAVAKVSGAPEIEKVVSEDIEEVVITFTKNIDLVTGSNVANYSISGVEIEKAEVDENEVTLTTVGLKNKTKYTVKATNVKSVDGTTKKTDSDSFTSKFDTSAPKIANVVEETNQRLKVTFNEDVTEESAENLANYAIKIDETDGASLEIVSVEWDSDDENFVFVVTEPQEKNEDYVLSVNGIVDQRKAANTMTRPSTEDFEGVDEDEKAPKLANVKVPAPNKVLVTFTDDSRIDEATATDLNNYDLEGLDIDEITVVQDDYQIFRVMLTVEDMETGESYDLTVESVADEFANAMDEDKETVRATSASIAAVKVNSAVATGENTILVVFSDEVDEVSAENIANYDIAEIGAPTKAEFEKTGAPANSVTLTVNDMINGYGDYDMTIDGVLDLAGNVLFYEPTVNTTTNKWDKSAPEIEDVEAVNNKVVAVTFDEKVKFELGAELVLVVGNNEANQIQLVANDYDEDDTVVEFAYANTLSDTVELSVYKVVYKNVYTQVYNPGVFVDGGIKDLIGNPILVTDITRTDYAFNGNSTAPEGMDYDSYTQIDGKTFEIVFPRDVNIYGTDSNFAISYKSATNKYTVRLKKNVGLIDENTDYTFDFSGIFKDLHGVTVAETDDVNNDNTNESTILTGEYKDEDAPYIDEVTASNRLEIEVKFNERIDETTVETGDFDLDNYDLDEDVAITGLDDVSDNDGTIILIVTKPLEARYEYALTIKDKNKVADVAGLYNESAETFYFDGSNLQN